MKSVTLLEAYRWVVRASRQFNSTHSGINVTGTKENGGPKHGRENKSIQKYSKLDARRPVVFRLFSIFSAAAVAAQATWAQAQAQRVVGRRTGLSLYTC
jgi:hypothetical protein